LAFPSLGCFGPFAGFSLGAGVAAGSGAVLAGSAASSFDAFGAPLTPVCNFWTTDSGEACFGPAPPTGRGR